MSDDRGGLFLGSVLSSDGIAYVRARCADGWSVVQIVESMSDDLPDDAVSTVAAFFRLFANGRQAVQLVDVRPRSDREIAQQAPDGQTVDRPLTAEERVRVRELALAEPDVSCREIARRIGLPTYCMRKMAAYVAFDRRARSRTS